MSGDSPPPRAWPRLRVSLLWICGVALTVTAAFLSVQTAFDRTTSARPNWKEIQRAEALGQLAADLDALLQELESAPRGDSPSERVLWETRVQNDLRPRVSEFRFKVIAAAFDGDTYQALLMAADRLGAAAANPGDERALDAARAARDTLQEKVGAEVARYRAR